MAQSYINVWVHVVWSTKYKARWMDKSWRVRLFQFMKEKAKENSYHLDFVNGVEDHVHLLIKLRSTEKLCDIVKNIKGSSSFWVNQQQLTEGLFSWQNGYSGLSVSPDRVKVVRNYIRNQEEHHKKQSFDDELKMYFSKSEIDPKDI